MQQRMTRLTTPGHDGIVRDDTTGRMLLNMDDVARAAVGEPFSRIHWLMRVDSIDPSQADGSSLCGEAVTGTTAYVRAGVYVCRVSLKEVYVAFHLDNEGCVWPRELVAADCEDWALQLWPALRSAGVPERPR